MSALLSLADVLHAAERMARKRSLTWWCGRPVTTCQVSRGVVASVQAGEDSPAGAVRFCAEHGLTATNQVSAPADSSLTWPAVRRSSPGRQCAAAHLAGSAPQHRPVVAHAAASRGAAHAGPRHRPAPGPRDGAAGGAERRRALRAGRGAPAVLPLSRSKRFSAPRGCGKRCAHRSITRRRAQDRGGLFEARGGAPRERAAPRWRG